MKICSTSLLNFNSSIKNQRSPQLRLQNYPADSVSFSKDAKKELDMDTKLFIRDNYRYNESNMLEKSLIPIAESVENYDITGISARNVKFLYDSTDKKCIFELAEILDGSIDTAINFMRKDDDFLDYEDSFDEVNNFFYGEQNKETREALENFRLKTGIDLKMDYNLPKENVAVVGDFVTTLRSYGFRPCKEIFITNFMERSTQGFHCNGKIHVRPAIEEDGTFNKYQFRTWFHENTHYVDRFNIEERLDNTKPFEKSKCQTDSAKKLLTKYALTNSDEFVAEVGMLILSGKIKFVKNKHGENVFRVYNRNTPNGKYYKSAYGIAQPPATEYDLRLAMSEYYKQDGPKFKPKKDKDIPNPDIYSVVEVTEAEIKKLAKLK